MRDFKNRSTETELMDEDDIPFDEYSHCLHSLRTINVLTFAYRPTLQWIQGIIKEHTLPLVILDVASGGGDMARRVQGLDTRNTVIAVDLHPFSKQYALKAFPDSSVIHETADIFEFNTDNPVDIVMCSLFTHHLGNEQIVHFLRWLDKTAQKGWFINDLHRHWIPYYFIKAATGLFSGNRLIRNDSAVSVARSFTKRDWQDYLQKAGIENAKVKWFFPFRICVSCEKI